MDIFIPNYQMTLSIARNLMRIEAVKEKSAGLPMNPSVLSSLRETAKLYTTHYSTMIEGNRLNPQEVQQVVHLKGHFPGRERDEYEVKGYYAALDQVDIYVKKALPVSENMIQTLHALVMGDGNKRVKPSPYRDGQNVIRDRSDGRIIYLPPEAKDVSSLMRSLVQWINGSDQLPIPLLAAIAHYQFATIHPYYDGNGRTSRLLTTLILHLGGYDLKGLYALEEYYAKNLMDYYRAISIGPSHNYYMGRAESDITEWIEYFIEGMADAFEKVESQMRVSCLSGDIDHSFLLRKLDSKQRKVLTLFREYEVITSQKIAELFGFNTRTGAYLCRKWVASGFLEIEDPSNKTRTYRLAERYMSLLSLERVD